MTNLDKLCRSKAEGQREYLEPQKYEEETEELRPLFYNTCVIFSLIFISLVARLELVV